MMYSKIAGKLIQKSEVETLRLENPTLNAKQIGQMLGVGQDLIYQFYHQYGWVKPKPKNSNGIDYNYITPDQIIQLLKDNPNLTTFEIAKILGTSISRVENTKSEHNIKSEHKGRKIPMTEDELKNRVEHLVKYTGMQRQEMAWELDVTAPTIGNYVKILKSEGRIDKDFSFRKRLNQESEK